MQVVVTGLGAVSAYGFGCDLLWDGIARGEDNLRPITRFDMSTFSATLGALVPGFDAPEQHRLPTLASTDYALWAEFALPAAREALREARLMESELPRHRIALVVGSLRAHRAGLHDLAEVLGEALGLAGPRINVSTACASSTHALALAGDLLRSGAADAVLAGGADVITLDMFAGFHKLGLLSPSKCAPFGTPDGTTLGEGAGFLVLESQQRARARGAAFDVELRGYGLSSDGHHATTPDPSGAGIARALSLALTDARVDPEQIGYVNVHGTGTANNDPAEWRAIERVFGTRAASLPVSSSKSFLGHAQGAAGALEAIATLLGLRRAMIPPTMHVNALRPRCAPDPVAEGTPRPCQVQVAASISSAFGGANAVLVFARPGLPQVSELRAVTVVGAGAVHPTPRRVPAIDLTREVPMADPRGLDPTALFLTTAVARALRDADIVVRGDLRERAGLFTGTSRLSPSSGREYEESLARSPNRPSASAFTRIVLNAPAGACSRLLSLRGPSTTIAAGSSSGLLAIIAAVDHLAHHPGADLIAAAGVDELAEDEEPGAEGAACLVLGSADGPIGVGGTGIAGPGRLDDAIALALTGSGLARADVDVVLAADPTAQLLPSAASAMVAVDAVAALRKGARSALVLDAGERSAACALLLIHRGG